MKDTYVAIDYRTSFTSRGFYIDMYYEKNGKEMKPRRYNENQLENDVITLPCKCRVEPDGTCHHGLQSPLLGARII